MNKKSQSDIITIVAVIIGLLLLAPILVKIVLVPLDKFSDAINQSDPGASAGVEKVSSTFLGFIDTIIILAFVVNIILLLIASFLVPTHPVFLVIYIFMCAFTMIFIPDIIEAVTHIWDSPDFLIEISYLTMTNFLLNHFGTIILAIMVLSGIIMYGKWRMTQQQF